MRAAFLASIVTLTLLASCAARQGPESPAAAAPQVNPYQVFATALEAIGEGDIASIVDLRGRPEDERMGDFLRQLYARYGGVTRIYLVSFFQEGEVSRGVFLAAHRNGPFLWDLIHDGESYTLVRGANEFEPYEVPTKAPDAVLAKANEVLDLLNEGAAARVFDDLICNCVTSGGFHKQVDELTAEGGTEERRRRIYAESVPGTEGQMFRVHFLSERTTMKLGFHILLWKLDGEWKINAVNWSQVELLPAPPMS